MMPYRLFIEKAYTDSNKNVDFKKMSIDFKSHIVSNGEIPFLQKYSSSDDASPRVKELYIQIHQGPGAQLAEDHRERVKDEARMGGIPQP